MSSLLKPWWFLCWTTGLAPALAAGPTAPTNIRNVVLIVIDALRADELGAYGYSRPTSPNIDDLAKEGAIFEQATAQADWTLPSDASIMTSLSPQVHGAVDMPHDKAWDEKLARGTLIIGPGKRLDPWMPTLAEVLSARGYATAGATAAPFTFSPFGISRGFQEYHEDYGNLKTLNTWILPWLSKHKDRPFFLFVQPNEVHDPYGSRGVTRRWDLGYRGKIDASVDTLDKITARELSPSPEDMAHIRALYDDGVSFVDEQLGRVVEALRDLKLLDRTLIIVTSDHGDGFAEHGLMTHGDSPYDELLRVPLIARLPEGPRGVRIGAQARSIDIFPTILDFLGIQAPAAIQGRSLLPLLKGGPAGDRTSYALARTVLLDKRKIVQADVIRTPEWKFVRYPDGTTELYDLSKDPGERHDTAAENPAQVEALGRRLSAWKKASEGLRRSLSKGQEAAPPQKLGSDIEDQLKALGYDAP